MINTVQVEINGEVFTTEKNAKLISLCDNNITDLEFMCRAGACGVCLIKVIEGRGNITEKTEEEKILLPMLTDDKDARLACQVKIMGDIAVQKIEEFA